MPSTVVDTPEFPTVPQLPGVPPLNVDPNAAVPALPTAVSSDTPGIFSGFGSSGRWGLYTQGGQAALTADAVSSLEYARDYAISDYPQTEGAFASYNKVQRPFQAKIIFLVGTNRPNFLNQMEAIAKALDLFTVVTPEISYPSANVVHCSYRRIAANGVTLIQVEVWVEEVRIVNTGQLSQGQSTNSAETNQNGPVQPTDATRNEPNAATDGSAGITTFSTPSGLSVGIASPTGSSAGTQLGTTVGQEFGTTIVTEPLDVGIQSVQPGLPITPPDVAISSDGTTQVVPIPPP